MCVHKEKEYIHVFRGESRMLLRKRRIVYFLIKIHTLLIGNGAVRRVGGERNIEKE